MNRDVIVNTYEMEMASYQLCTYANFLVSIIDEYNAILDDVKSSGYVDLAVRSQISSYQFYAGQFKAPIRNAWRSVDSAIVGYCQEVSSVDTFSFPMRFDDYISRALDILF